MTENVSGIVEHLFRHEAGKLASSLTRAYGLSRLDAVEDIVQDTMLAALTDWQFRGIPENPTAWLHRAALNKAVDRIRRKRLESDTAAELLPGLREASVSLELERNFLEWEIEDSQLRMMFACCHPGLPVVSQIALTLKTLCGFSVKEIANALLSQESAIEKRLTRARKFFREEQIELEVPDEAAVTDRLPTVLHCLYLLFNEGYKRTANDGLLDRDLCLEALRLALLVADHPRASTPEACALVALMSLLAARFEARMDEQGNIVLLGVQDRVKWNTTIIRRGFEYFERSRFESSESTYHIEAAIQALHMSSNPVAWPAVLGLYKRLYQLNPNPIVALHMSVAICEVSGADEAISWIRAHPLPDYYLYHAVLADTYAKAGTSFEAIASYEKAIELTTNKKERVLLQNKLEALR